MILVDTSVLIDYLKGNNSDKTRIFEEILSHDIPFGLSAYTYQEVFVNRYGRMKFPEKYNK